MGKVNTQTIFSALYPSAFVFLKHLQGLFSPQHLQHEKRKLIFTVNFFNFNGKNCFFSIKIEKIDGEN